MQETTYYTARKMQWDRVHASGQNDGESVAAVNACGGTWRHDGHDGGGLRERRAAEADANRAGAGAHSDTGPRPTQARGDVTYFDTTGPHRGPGKAAGYPAGKRVVLYCSWAKGAWEREGSPAYAYKPRGVPKGQYQLVYDAKGQYTLTESSPANLKESNAKGAAKRRASFMAQQEQTLAADALAGMASA
jgi:hypothetical protein